MAERNFLGDRYFTIKDIEMMLYKDRYIVSVDQENKWIAILLDNSVVIKIKNF